MNLITASDLNIKVARDVKQRAGNNIDSMATLKYLLRVKDGGKIWFGSESENVLNILSELIAVVANIANTASSHTHPYTDNGTPLNTKAPNERSAFSGRKGSADSIKARLNPMVE